LQIVPFEEKKQNKHFSEIIKQQNLCREQRREEKLVGFSLRTNPGRNITHSKSSGVIIAAQTFYFCI